MMHADTTISIVTFSALEHAKKTLAAILSTLDGAHLILTANGNKAAADYFNAFRQEYPHTTVVVNQINQGFIGPNNSAFSLCTTPLFVMLNDDAIPPPDWLDRLKLPFHADPMCAVSGAKGTCQTLNENFIGYPGEQLDYIEFSCAMVRSEFMSHPLFSDYLRFAFCEDADLCLRMREKGYSIHQADFKVQHNRNTTVRTVPGIKHIMATNFATCRKRWSYYLQHRKFEP